MDKHDIQQIAARFAPIICQELSQKESKRKFDCFTRIDFSEAHPWNDFDRMIEYDEAYQESRLFPAVYYSFVATKSHYFLLYSVYHAFDQKWPFGHEHDMEHVQVVVRSGGDTIEMVSTNAHHAYYYYVPYAGSLPRIKLHLAKFNDCNDHGRICLADSTNPVVYVQPGDGSLGGIVTEQIGHGIMGIGGVYRGGMRDWSDRWNQEKEEFRFRHKSNKEPIGIVAKPAMPDDELKPYKLESKGITKVSYKLINVFDDVWSKWFLGHEGEAIGGLFEKKRQWLPTKNKFFQDSESRYRYFLEQIDDKVNSTHYPSGFVGSFRSDKREVTAGNPEKARRKADGKWPFSWKNRVSGDRYFSVRNPRVPWEWDVVELDAFFDVANAYRILADVGVDFDPEYLYHPFLDI